MPWHAIVCLRRITCSHVQMQLVCNVCVTSGTTQANYTILCCDDKFCASFLAHVGMQQYRYVHDQIPASVRVALFGKWYSHIVASFSSIMHCATCSGIVFGTLPIVNITSSPIEHLWDVLHKQSQSMKTPPSN